MESEKPSLKYKYFAKVPRNIFQTKVNAIRIKIIKRKYAYLLLHKFFGRVLPSQARNFYLQKLFNNCLRKWEIYWFERKVKWRIILRANIHYRFVIYRRYFFKWKTYVENRKIKKINTIIADKFFTNRLRIKCFILLKKNKDLSKIIRHYRKLLNFRIDLKTQHVRLLETKLWLLKELKLQWFFIYLRPIYNKILLQRSLKVLENYKDYAKRRRILKVKLQIFIQVRYDPQFMRPFFKFWIKYAKLRKEYKVKNKTAMQLHASHLKRIYFQKLRIYGKERRIIVQKLIKALTFYNNKLKLKVIRLWESFMIEKNRKLYLNQKADRHFQRKVLCVWKCYCVRKKLILNFTKERELNYVRKSMLTWKTYILHRKRKNELLQKADNHFSKLLLKQYFIRLMKYQNYKMCKEIYQLEDIQVKRSILNSKRLQFSFKKWKMFHNYKQKQKNQLQIAITFRIKKILAHSFKKWCNWKIYKLEKIYKYKVATNFYTYLIQRMYFAKWKMVKNFEKEMKKHLEIAQDQYKIYLLQTGLKTIIETGMYFQKLRHNINIRRSIYIFELTQKYFKIWKYKTWNSNKPVIQKQLTKIQNLPAPTENTIFHDFSNLRPRVPDFLKNKFLK